MKLNVLGNKLLPLDDGRMADENLPICAIITEQFSRWIKRSGDLHAVIVGEIGTSTLLPAETWIQAYQDNSHPPMTAEHSHERALYWIPLEMFTASKQNESTNGARDDYQIDIG